MEDKPITESTGWMILISMWVLIAANVLEHPLASGTATLIVIMLGGMYFLESYKARKG